MKMRLLALLSLVAVLAGFSSCGKTETEEYNRNQFQRRMLVCR